MKKNIKNNIIRKIQGFSLIELIVAIAIFSILASGVVYVFTTSYKNFFGVGDKQVMVQFAQEGMEAVRSIRDNDWQTIVDAADGSDRGVQKNNIPLICGEYSVTSNFLTYGTVEAADSSCWLDKNIGASRVAQASDDAAAYGYLYQWGRSSDVHQITNYSGTTATLSSSDTPNHPDFITASAGPYDWRSSQNDNLWQGVNGTNNVCPTGFRVPTRAEWTTLLTAENITSIATAYSSSLKLTVNGYRDRGAGTVSDQGTAGNYWSSTVSGTDAGLLYFDAGGVAAPSSAGSRAYGLGVRCVKAVASPCGETVSSNSLNYGTVAAADGNCWLDRNIGATRVAQASNDISAYGYLYQWGRSSDGHHLTPSNGTTTTLSSSDTPNHPDFITASAGPYDWRSSQNDNLWQGVNGTNNVCPTGFRVPTRAEWTAVLAAENITSIATAYSSVLKLTLNGYRERTNGAITAQGSGGGGNYWSSTVSGTDAGLLYFDGGGVAAPSSVGSRAYGLGVRCILEDSPASSGFSWQFSGTSNTLNALTRVIVVSDVQRNSAGSIVASGGTDDPDTKKVTVTVSGAGIADYVLTTFLTNSSAKTWEQTDWSGTSSNEFWASMVTASSSYNNISTSTVGQISLAQTAGSDMSWSSTWTDLLPDESVRNQPWEDFYQLHLGPDGKSLYVIGTTNFDFVKYDISRAQSGIIKAEWKIEVPWHMRTMALHPSGNYAYLATSTPGSGGDTICVANVATLSINTASDCYDLTYPGLWWSIHSMIVNADGDRLYVFDSYGYGYVFSISGGGATLTLLNTRQLLVSGAGNAINQAYLDESGAEPYIYLVTNDNSYEFRKMGIHEGSGWFSSTSTYAFADSSSASDFYDIDYLETVGGKKRFLFGTGNSSKELIIYEDQGTSLTEIGSYNLATSQAYAEVISDGENMAFISYYSPAGLYAVDITNRASPVNGNLSNTTFNRKSSNVTYDQMVYSTSSHGFFVPDHQVTGDRVNLHFIGKSFTRATGNTYNYKRAITVGLGSTVSSGPHTDFPVAISETQDYLRTISNGGKVYNSNGYDIIFASDSAGTTVLDHEIETYNPSTGELVAWVKIPTLDTNTTIYMFYGNSDITSTQEHVDGVWSNGYQLVNHMVDSGIGATSDSVVGSNNLFKYGVNAPAQSAGKIGRGQNFDGTLDFLTLENTVDKDQSNYDFTVEFWMKRSSSAVPYSYWAPVFFGSGDVNQDGWMFRQQSADKRLQLRAGDGTTNLASLYTNNVIADDVWTHVAMTAKRDTGFQYYINTNTDSSCTIAAACTVDSTAKYIGETYVVRVGGDWSTTSLFFTGEVDELRISTGTPRTQGWITTGYNNVTATSTFYSIASETAAAYYQSSGSIVSSIIDLGSSDKILDSIKIFQSVPSGCSLSLALEGSNNTDFSGYTSEAFSDSSAPNFTSSTPDSLNNLRYFRYRLNLTACNSNSQTPSLYSLRLNYR